MIDLTAEEAKILVDVIRYALDMCPVETISDQVAITREKLEELMDKLEMVVKSIKV